MKAMTLRLEDGWYQRLVSRCRESGISVSDGVRAAVEAWLAAPVGVGVGGDGEEHGEQTAVRVVGPEQDNGGDGADEGHGAEQEDRDRIAAIIHGVQAKHRDPVKTPREPDDEPKPQCPTCSADLQPVMLRGRQVRMACPWCEKGG